MYEDDGMITTEEEAKELYNEVVETFYDEPAVDEDAFNAPELRLVDDWKRTRNDYENNEMRMFREDIIWDENELGVGTAYLEQRMTDNLVRFYDRATQ